MRVTEAIQPRLQIGCHGNGAARASQTMQILEFLFRNRAHFSPYDHYFRPFAAAR
jgi:hypothetical protein